MTEGSVSRRYAKALLAIAQDDNAVDRFGAELERFHAVVGLDGHLLGNALANPVFTPEERKQVLEQVLGALKLDSTVANFLRLLLDKNRMDGIDGVVREYRAFADIEANRVRATVTSATKLNAATQKKVQAALAEATGKSVVLDVQVDPTLIGGIVAQVGSRVFDASIRSRIERLALSLADHPAS